ncbi:MAG: hypothetical protein LIP12_03540, partial [Clostridiales bacterium]|nr:hypothetical protein [Clostridiales bacterium]
LTYPPTHPAPAAARYASLDDVPEAATDEATDAATEEATEAATEEATEAATEEATEEATEAATEEVTEEATEAATEESTEEVNEKDKVEVADAANEKKMLWRGGETAAEVMSYDEYIAADLDSLVVVETYVQAKQSWWDDTATVYTQDEDGAYFLYNMACSEEDYELLEVGTKILVTGYKSEWSGEVEIIDASFEIVDDGETFIAETLDVTELLGTDELEEHQNEYVSFTGMTVEASEDADGNEAAFLYAWDGSGTDGDDLYFNVSYNGETYTFTVESYLCDNTTEVYQAVTELNVGDVIDMEGFLYWYEGVNPHITSVVVTEAAAEEVTEAATEEATEAATEEATEAATEEATEAETEEATEATAEVMSYDEYIAADMDTLVVVETYVQAKQSWWDDTATVYTQDEDGAYFLYNMACSEEDYELLEVGTKILVTGYKSEWSGEVEIIDASFEIVDDGETFIAEALDVTELLGTDELEEHQNEYVSFTGMTVEASEDADGNEAAFLYAWDGSGEDGDDLYFNVSYNGETYTFTVESYLCDNTTEVYQAVTELNVGDVIDMEGFLYWYEGVNPHITSVSVVEAAGTDEADTEAAAETESETDAQ